MQTDLLSLPGYRICEYMLVLHPHEELSTKIAQVKKDFAEKFDAPAAEWGKPQIVLARFSQIKMMEERITNRLKMIAMALPAFKIELKDYGTFPTHSIFINIETKAGIQMVVKNLKQAQPLMKTKEIKPQFIADPYLLIARQLLPWQYEKGWLEYSHKHFTGKFIASQMLLMRRSEGNKSFQTIQNFEFLNMPVVTTQGALF